MKERKKERHQNQPSSQQQRTHNPNSAFRPILMIGNQNSTNHLPTNVFSGHQTTAKGITNINGVPIPAQPALLPTNQGDQRTATNWTSRQPTLTHQCTQPAIRSYQEGFPGTTTAYNPRNMSMSSTTAFTHAGCRGPTGTTYPNINRHPLHQHAVHQHAAHQNQPTYFPIPTNLGTAPTDHNHRQWSIHSRHLDSSTIYTLRQMSKQFCQNCLPLAD